MATDGTERGANRATGPLGRIAKHPFRNMLLCGMGAVAAGYFLAGGNSDGPPVMRDMGDGVGTIRANAQVNQPPLLRDVVANMGSGAPPAGVPVPNTQATPPAGAVLPEGNTGGYAPPPAKPARVATFRTPKADKRAAERERDRERREQQTAAAAGGGPAGAPGQRQQPEQTGIQYAAQQMPGLQAGPPQDDTFMMRPGLYRMTLVTAINSERCDGPFFAKLSQPVRSPAGVLLMEKDSLIQGECSSQIGPGQSRISTATAWGLTPDNVPVPLGKAAGADASGRGGFDGVVDTHWRERMGNALVLLLTQAATQAASTALNASLSSGNGTNINVNTSTIDTALASVLRNGSLIQNTVDVAQGAEVSFLLRYPVDFSRAYRLAPTGQR